MRIWLNLSKKPDLDWPTPQLENVLDSNGVTEKEGLVVLSVKDDGKGLNTQALGRKAVSLGLIPAGTEPGEEQIIDLLFASGVSTASKVTDVSGRGVGMNVVKQNIDEMNGRINVINQSIWVGLRIYHFTA